MQKKLAIRDPESFQNDLKVSIPGYRESPTVTMLSNALQHDSWTELKVKDKFIDKRSYQCAVIHDSKLYIYGGSDLNRGIFSDFNYVEISEDFTLSIWKEVNIKGKSTPGLRSRAISVLVGDDWYIYGGLCNSTESTNQLWAFNFRKSEWKQIKSKSQTPPPLDSHAGVLYKNAKEQYVWYIFGGFLGGKQSEYWNQTIEFNFSTGEWTLPYGDKMVTKIEKAPSPRGGHAMSLYKDDFYVCGGTNGEVKFHDLWKYNLVQKSWSNIKCEGGPTPRNGHTILNYKDYFILFGGIQDITHEKDDVLLFSYLKQKWVTLEADSVHSRSYSPHKDEKSESLSPHRQYRHQASMKSGYSPTKVRSEKRTKTEKIIDSPGKIHGDTANQSFNLGNISENRSPKNAVAIAHEEKRKKLFQIQKNILLKEFEVAEPEKKKYISKSPTTESMKDSLAAITYRRPGDIPKDNHTDTSSPKKKTTTNFNDLSKLQVPVDGKLIGHKPCARDGHSALWHNGRMLIFGGDRHKMSFNDIHIMSVEPVVSNRKDI